MGEIIAKIALATLGVIAGYNVLTHGNVAQGIISSGSSGGATLIKSLEGR